MKLTVNVVVWTPCILVCLIHVVLLSVIHKKPTFCDQDGDPFSFLWMIKADPPSYLFGTIHVPYTKVWDHIPNNAKLAFESCSSVFFELDLMDPDTVSALSTCQMLPHGMNLSEVLPEDLYDRLKRHLEYVKGMMPKWMTEDQKGRGMYADYLFKAIAGNWERKRPVWVMLMVNSLTESDVRSRGVPVLDLYLAQEAERMRKTTGAVEKVEEQCLPLNGLNLSQVLFALNHTLHQHEELREGDFQASYTTDDLIHHYNCGDLDAVIFSQDTTQVPTLSNSTLTEEDAAVAGNIDLYFRQELIHNRNMRMGNRVAELLHNHPGQSLFFAFGAGHFLGNNTVLDFVQEYGYEIEHLTVDSKIPEPKTPLRPVPFAKTAFRVAGASIGEKKKIKDGGTVWWKNNNQGRRPNRRKTTSPQQGGAPRPNTPTTSVQFSTPRPRHFNDLWVRLDDYHRQTSHLSDGTSKLDSDLVQKILRRRYQPGHHMNAANVVSYSAASAILYLTIYFAASSLQNLTFELFDDHTGIT